MNPRDRNKNEPDRIWPGAVEAGLQTLPKISPIVVDLTGPESQCWMNVNAATREKGAPLTKAEEQRIYAGKHWHRPSARRKRQVDPFG